MIGRHVVFRIASALLALGWITCAPALAQTSDQRSSPLPGLLPLKTEACFGRTYDAAHLSAHPKQRVTSFHIFRDFSPDQNAEDVPQTREDLLSDDGSDGGINVTAFVRFRDRKGVFSNGLNCRKGAGGKTVCAIDCDGGSFDLRANGGSLIVNNNGFVVVGGCGGSEEDEDNPEYVQPGADDRTFRLDKQPVAQCTALRDALNPAWARLGRPLRERLSEDGALCLTRSYDAAHLASHPGQLVRRIAVLKAAATKEQTPDWPSYKLSFHVELKDGKTLRKSLNCWPDTYAYTCQPDTSDGNFYLTRAGDDVMLRDQRGLLAKTFGTELGSDDRMFRLQPADAKACAF